MFGIYINCANAPFVGAILAHRKTDETRTRDVFRAILGERIALIETGTGPAPMVRGYATLTSARRVSFDDVDARRTAAILGTPYDITPGGTKIFYHLDAVRACIPYPVPADRISHGRSYCEFSRPISRPTPSAEVLDAVRNDPRDPYGPPVVGYIVRVNDPEHPWPLYVRTYSRKGYTWTTDHTYARHFTPAAAQKHARALTEKLNKLDR